MKVYIIERFEQTDEGLLSSIEDVYINETQAYLRKDKLTSLNNRKKVYYEISEFEIKGKLNES